jgi:hypothetical protein
VSAPLLIWCLVNLLGTAPIHVQSVNLSTDAVVTKVTVETDKVIVPQVELEGATLYLVLPGITNPSLVSLPLPTGLITGLKWDAAKGKFGLALDLSSQTGSYKAYSTTSPPSVVVEVRPKVEIKAVVEPKIVPSLSSEFDVAIMGKTLLLDDDDGVINGNAAAGVDVDWWYQRPMAYMKKEVESFIVRTGTHLPPASVLAPYDTVIYYSGCDQVPLLLEEADTASLRQYVRDGGHLLMFCQNLLGVPAGIAFVRETIGMTGFKEDTCVKGVKASPPLGDLDKQDLNLRNDYRPIGNWSDGFALDPNRKDTIGLVGSPGDEWLYAAVGNYGKGRIVIATFAQENLSNNLVRMYVIRALLAQLWAKNDPIGDLGHK